MPRLYNSSAAILITSFEEEASTLNNATLSSKNIYSLLTQIIAKINFHGSKQSIFFLHLDINTIYTR